MHVYTYRYTNSLVLYLKPDGGPTRFKLTDSCESLGTVPWKAIANNEYITPYAFD